MKRIFTLLLFALLRIIPCEAQTTSPTWDVIFKNDHFADSAALDLRFLNEAIAGQNGFIKLSADGKSFVTENGQPIKFWPINTAGLIKELDDAELKYFARFLAKMGVNMVRFHSAIQSKGANINDVDMQEVNDIWRTVAAMKKEGIYSAISPFWAHSVDVPASWGLGEYTGEHIGLWALMYFNDTLKNAYKKWVEVLYTQVNPHTGIALKDDASVALILIKNEDSVLFWTLEGVKPGLRATIEGLFFNWLVNKYGSISAAYSAWSNDTRTEDNVTERRMSLYHTWELTQAQTGGKAVRLNDQMEFLTRHQEAFYEEIAAYHKTTLQCKQLVCGNNWRPADVGRMNDAERWSNASSSIDVMAVNRYYDPEHRDPSGQYHEGWRIDPGHTYVGASVLKEPALFPINIKQVHDKPFFVTESGWVLPHKYQSEGPFLVAAYSALTGIDGFFWFNPSSHQMDPDPYYPWFDLGGGQKAMLKWTNSTPGGISMFPANALLYRKGYITPGATVVHEERTLESLWKRELPIIAEEASFDPNRDNWDNPNTPETEVSPLAYLVGPVEVKYGGNPVNNMVSGDLSTKINTATKTVTSTTGQLKWNYDKGLCTMNSPSAQGVSGFLKAAAPTVELSDVTITSDNAYATVNVVAMDDKPLATSEKIFVQVGTIYRPTGWQETAKQVDAGGTLKAGFEIVNTGKMPWQAENTKMSIKLKNTTIKSAHVLDPEGYVSKEIAIERHADHLIINLPANAMYVVFSTREPKVGAVAVTGVSVSPSSLSLEVNKTGQLNAVITPSNATNKNVTWSSSNTAVATVSASGLVTGKAAGSATITVTTQDGSKTATASIRVTSGETAAGSIGREVWANVKGKTLSSIPVNTAPTSTSILTSLEAPANIGDNYGTRIRGYITPAISGYYTFYIAADEQAELWLSPSDNPAQITKIAEVTRAVKPREWNKSAAQKSYEIVLTAGVKHYIEVLHRDAKGADHVAVGWTGPGIPSITVIAGNVLSPFTPAAPRLASDVVNNEVSVYPNPVTNGNLNIIFSSQAKGNGSITLTNALGIRASKNAVSINEGENIFNISTTGLASGLYILTLEQGGKQIIKKVYIK